MKDIVDAIAEFRVAFLRENLKPPIAILLENHEEGMRLLSFLKGSNTWMMTVGDPRFGVPVEMADGSVYMELELMGMKVRWPANKYEKQDGSWGWA